MKKVTFILLNWKRPENLIKVIKSIRNQTIDCNIFLWNNNIADTTKYDVDFQINSSDNIICYGRWLMLPFVTTEFVATLDDDLMFNRNDILEKELELFDGGQDDLIVGPYGRNITTNYSTGSDITKPNQRVDVIKGRHMLMRTPLPQKLNLVNEPDCEDIKVCSLSNNKITTNYKDFTNLSEGNVGLWNRPIHFINRDTAYQKYFIDSIYNK